MSHAAPALVRRLWPIRSLTTSIVLLCSVFLALFTSLLVYGLVLTRQHYLDEAMGAIEGLAGTYTAYTEKAVKEIDFSLLLVQDYARQLDSVGPRLMQSVAPILELRRRHTPYVANLIVIDARGVVVSATNAASVAVGRDVNDRDYFSPLRSESQTGLHIGPIFTARWVDPGQKRFSIGRRLTGARGQFLGAVLAMVDAQMLAQDYARQIEDPTISVTLMRLEGMVLTRHPYLQEQTGQVLPSFARYQGAPPGRSSFIIKSQIDQSARLMAQRRFDDLPLLIAVTQLEGVALQRWQAALRPALGVWILVVLATFGLGAAVLYQQGQRERAQVRLRDSLEAFNAAQQLAQVGSVDLDLVTGEQRWSDEMFRLLDIDRDRKDLNVDMRHERIHPEDRELVAHAIGQSRALKLPYKVNYRLQMPDGRIKWLTEGCALRCDGMGRPVREIIILQDITTSKQAEEALVNLHAELDARTGRRARDPFSVP